ncbi:MAG: thiamine-phosphate kinase [Burkholderiaceae bacterium]|nr:thiamine-phosphate kinase [Burkholderiaceae bacterium]
MSLGEFDLIAKYFDRPTRRAMLGIGDDCALLAVPPGMQLATSCDMLVEGRHFLSTVAPGRLGHKALAVNLSDLAACGAEPLAFTLALALPSADEAFLEGFSRGLLALADVHGCELIGGDTTRGPLNICISVFGQVPAADGGGALLRSGARAGDDLYVSGTLGDARLALEAFRGTLPLQGADFETVRRAMEMPQPRVALGQALRGVASSAIDLSDGLLGDLGHVLQRSAVDAVVEVDAVPRSAVLRAQPMAVQRLCTLSGGDDYELLFTAPPGRAAQVSAAGRSAGVALTRIGRIVPRADGRPRPHIELIDAKGHAVVHAAASFDHFRA